MTAKWFFVKCAECANQYGVDVAPRLFRADIANWGDARVEVRTKTGWGSLLIEDNDRMFAPVVNCAHNHRFEDSMRRGTLIGQIGRAIEAAHAIGAEFGLLEPTNDGRAPGEERAVIRRIEQQYAVVVPASHAEDPSEPQ